MRPKFYYELDEQPLSPRGNIAFLIVVTIIVGFVILALSRAGSEYQSVLNFCKDNNYQKYLDVNGKDYCGNERETIAIAGREIKTCTWQAGKFACEFVSEGDIYE